MNLGQVISWIISETKVITYQSAITLLGVIYIFISCVLLKTIKEEVFQTIAQVSLITVSCLILFNVTMVIPNVINRETSKTIFNNIKYDVSTVTTNERPNIYLLIMDEYSGSNTLKGYYDYDNSSFYNSLEELGFTVSKNSYNYSTDTTEIVYDLVNLNYMANVVDTTSERTKLLYKSEQPLFTLLRKLGYTVYEAESENIFDLEQRMPYNVSNTQAQTQNGETVTQIIIRNTLLYPFEEEIARQLDKVQMTSKEENGNKEEEPSLNSVLNVIDYYCQAKNFNLEKAFTITHILSPHTPFQFTKEGKMVGWENRANWDDKKYYLEQLQYLSTRILEMMKTIISVDPSAIIILQSDHAARGLSNITEKAKTNILNAVYYQGESLERIKDRNGLNTLRIVLEEKFGLNFPILHEEYLMDRVGSIEEKKKLAFTSGDIVIERIGDVFRFNTQFDNENASFVWEIYDKNGKMIEKANNVNAFDYDPELYETTYVVVTAFDKYDSSNTCSKICGIVEQNIKGKFEVLEFNLYEDLTSDSFTVKQIGEYLEITNNIYPDRFDLDFAWYILDDGYNAIYKTGYSPDRTLKIELLDNKKQIIQAFVRVKLGDVYRESYATSVCYIEYNDVDKSYTVEKMN